MKRLVLVGALLGALVPGAALAHEGGDAGGCAAMGEWLHGITREPEAAGELYGVPSARNLGAIAKAVAPHGSLAEFIENYEHVVFC
jgi:hypothetical protein